MFSSSYEINLPDEGHTTTVLYFEDEVQRQRINECLFNTDVIKVNKLDEVSDSEGSLYEPIHFVMYGGVKIFGIENALKYMFPKLEHFSAPNFKTNGIDDRTFLTHLSEVIKVASNSTGVSKDEEGNFFVGYLNDDQLTPIVKVPAQENAELTSNHLLMQYTAVVTLSLLGIRNHELVFFVTNPPADGVLMQNLHDVELLVLRAITMHTPIK